LFCICFPGSIQLCRRGSGLWSGPWPSNAELIFKLNVCDFWFIDHTHIQSHVLLRQLLK
jgi:hypothetical protein